MTALRLLWLFTLTWLETIMARLRRGPMRPSWDFSFECVVRFLRRDYLDSARWPYERLRRDLEARPVPSHAQRKVSISEDRIGGVPVVVFTPPEIRRRGALLFFHGGSYIFGSARRTHAELLASLALSIGARVIGPEYRLAPEHPYPAALEDALNVYSGIRANGLAAHDIVLAGDSAGGNLALALQLALRDRRVEQARALALVSPWLDLTASRPSVRRNNEFDYGNTSFLLPQARAFAGTIPLDDPRLSLINARLDGLAPLLVLVGDAELLCDEGVELVQRAKSAGVTAELHVAPDMPHNSPVLADYHRAAKAALDHLATYIAAQLTAV
jgi:epsilon-lactone hydrolase